mmetsp:Transcript_15957/g.39919  ORF Transcript_15957/g.39919 Transcript_15957/m.39919 type:complete len:249 (+) Transcript_15957:503-1249(+)
MRRQRTSVSWMALVSAWPRCSVPVTLGGGMTTTNGGLSESMSGLKKPLFSHHSYHAASTAGGQYALGMSALMSFLAPAGVARAASTMRCTSAASAAFFASASSLALAFLPPSPAAAFSLAAAAAAALAAALAFLASFSASLAAFRAAFSGSSSSWAVGWPAGCASPPAPPLPFFFLPASPPGTTHPAPAFRLTGPRIAATASWPASLWRYSWVLGAAAMSVAPTTDGRRRARWATTCTSAMLMLSPTR